MSSVPYWSAGSSDIPHQFLTSLEPPYRIAMGNSVPLYSMHKELNSAYSMLRPTAYNTALLGFDSRLGTDYPFSTKAGYECADVSAKVKQLSSHSTLSTNSSTEKVGSVR